MEDTPIFIQTTQPTPTSLAGSLVLNNIQLVNVPVAVGVADGTLVLRGGTVHIDSWGQGNIYRGSNPEGRFIRGNLQVPHKARGLLDSAGQIVSRTHPQYEDYDVGCFVSARDKGAKGDGVTDDTAALQAIFNEVGQSMLTTAIRNTDLSKHSRHSVIFLDAGFYIVTSTLKIPAGTRLVGEVWSVIAGKGPVFQDQKCPRVVVQVGEKHSQGILEITDIVFTTVGPGRLPDSLRLSYIADGLFSL